MAAQASVSQVPAPWSDALRVATLLATDPVACGGAVIRAGAGPVRDLWLETLRAALPPLTPWMRLPPGIGDDRLLGGLDLTATLHAGRPVAQAGLLAAADLGVVVVPMAERLPAGTVARLCAALDTGSVGLERDGLSGRRPARFALVLLDEGEEEDAVAGALADRLAFRIDLSRVAVRDVAATPPEPGLSRAASQGEDGVDDACDPILALCEVADELGVVSLRGPLLAARVTRLAARCGGRAFVTQSDAIEAARLVLAPRATRLPAAEQSIGEPTESSPTSAIDAASPPHADDAAGEEDVAARESLGEVVLDAARAAIPPNLLAALLAGGPRLRTAEAGRLGAAASARYSGRPVGSRPGDPRRGRLDLIATLRAAAPWQRLRRAQGQAMPNRFERTRIHVRPDDLRIKRFVQRSQTTAIFCVDASGSAALERLAEAKGAVEVLLAESYVRRDRVALIAFRGTAAQLLLSPTRSLVRAKRALRELPGGGGTPLAAGIDAATQMALAVRRAGGVPVLILLTDGRANVTRSGEGGRARAREEALGAARGLRALGLRTLIVDTGARPEAARRLAEAAQARYIPLPYADASALGATVRAAVRAAVG